MSQDELVMWMAYSADEPWGEDREDWRNALSCYTMASMWSSSSGSRKLKVSDFLLQFSRKNDKLKPSIGTDVDKWNYMILQAMFPPQKGK